MDFVIVPFDPKTASRGEWSRFHAFRRGRHGERDPDDPPLEDETVERAERRPHPDWDNEWFAVLDSTRPEVQIGEVIFEFSRPESPSNKTNANFAWCSIGLLSPYRRKGLGMRMLRKIWELARAHERTVLEAWVDEPDGLAFAAAIGATVVQKRRENRLRLENVDWAMVETWAKEGLARAPGTRLRWFQNRIDDDVLAPYCELYTTIFNQQPFEARGQGAIVFTPESFRDRESRTADMGARWLTAASVEPNGSLSGFTEVTYIPDNGWIIQQNLTGVRDPFRGRGLAKWLKAAMLRRVRTELPQVRVVRTENASSNAGMLSINERLGFRMHKERFVVDLKREALERYLHSRQVAKV